MLAGIVAALLGPEVGNRLSQVEGLSDYVGSFIWIVSIDGRFFFILLFFIVIRLLTLQMRLSR